MDRGSSLEEAARAAGLPIDEAERLAMMRAVVQHRQQTATRRRRQWALAVASMTVAGLTLLVSRPAFAQACAQTLPSPLVTFCPDAPAQASTVNGNFQQLVTWLQQKVGTVGSPNIATTGSISGASLATTGGITAQGDISTTGNASVANLTASGNVSASRAALSNGVIQRSGAAITATSDLGLYSRVAGNYVRFVANGAPFKFYTAEGANGIGVTANFSVEADANLTSTMGSEPEGTSLLPQSFCVVVPIGAGCPGNWDAREVKWDTEDSSNADFGKDGRVAIDNGNSGSVLMRFCCRGW